MIVQNLLNWTPCGTVNGPWFKSTLWLGSFSSMWTRYIVSERGKWSSLTPPVHSHDPIQTLPWPSQFSLLSLRKNCHEWIPVSWPCSNALRFYVPLSLSLILFKHNGLLNLSPTPLHCRLSCSSLMDFVSDHWISTLLDASSVAFCVGVTSPAVTELSCSNAVKQLTVLRPTPSHTQSAFQKPCKNTHTHWSSLHFNWIYILGDSYRWDNFKTFKLSNLDFWKTIFPHLLLFYCIITGICDHCSGWLSN